MEVTRQQGTTRRLTLGIDRKLEATLIGPCGSVNLLQGALSGPHEQCACPHGPVLACRARCGFQRGALGLINANPHGVIAPVLVCLSGSSRHLNNIVATTVATSTIIFCGHIYLDKPRFCSYTNYRMRKLTRAKREMVELLEDEERKIANGGRINRDDRT